MRRQRFRAGDVFRLLPLEDGSIGYGQIVASYGTAGGHFYFAVLRSAYQGDNPSIAGILEDEVALLALSMDALLFHGHWEVVGYAGVQKDRVRWPEYKVATAPGIYEVEDALATTSRPASPKDVALLPFRKVVSPIIVQHAFEALHGLREWSADYDHLRA